MKAQNVADIETSSAIALTYGQLILASVFLIGLGILLNNLFGRYKRNKRATAAKRLSRYEDKEIRNLGAQKSHYTEELKEVQDKLEEAKKLKASFLSNMNHEIRTPLNGILGSTANMILQNNHNPEMVAQLEIIMQSGERLLQTINNILDMSLLEANKMETTLEKTNINDFLSVILMPLKSLAIKKGLLITAKHVTKPFFALIDKRYFELIVKNIVENSIKYSEHGLIQVSLEKRDNNLLLSVQDSGIGISEDYLKKLFNPFEQESAGHDRKFEGSGLGLTIAKNLIDLLSGEIKITSRKGQGTTVTIILPLQEQKTL